MSKNAADPKSDPLQRLTLPPMPDSVQRIRTEQARPEPDIDRITEAVAGDVSLAAEVLKAVNSPAFGLSQTIGSIPNAVMMLGLDNVLNVVNGVALRISMGQGCNLKLDRFWDTAGDVATVASTLARELTGHPSDVAYTLGLMHDCGIPVLMCHLPGYREHLEAAQRQPGDNVTVAERERFGIDHAQVGARISATWNMPQSITHAIRSHHHFEALTEPDNPFGDDVASLVGVLKMAEHVSNRFRGLAFRNLDADHEWDQVGSWVLGYFGMSAVEFADRCEDLVAVLGQRA